MQWLKKKQSYILILVLSILITAWQTNMPVQAAAKVTKVTVSGDTGKTVYIAKGKTKQLKTSVKVTPNKAVNKKVQYKSKNAKIVTVSAKGKIKGIKAGMTRIRVNSKLNSKKYATIKVKVINPIKSLKLNQTQLKLHANASAQLKVKVFNPKKNIYKGITWSTSNKKVATVSTKGIVKAVGVGTAKITAVTQDGTKVKSKPCLVTVTKPAPDTKANLIQAVEVLTSKALRVTLSQAQSLQAGDFLVQTKDYANGKYITNFQLDNLTTTNNQVYDITLKQDALFEDTYILTTIKKLNGNGAKAKELLYQGTKQTIPRDQYIGSSTGRNVNEEVYFGDYLTGASTFVVGKLPAGLKYEVSGKDYITIKGTPTQAVENVITKITCTNELGKSITRNIHFFIGSPTTIVAYHEPIEVYPAENYYIENIETSYYCFGGSGSFYVSAIGSPSGLYLDGAWIYGTLTRPGTYRFPVEFTDKYNSSLKKQIDISIKVVQPQKVTGVITDSNGYPLPNAYISANSTDPNNTHYPQSTYTNENGEYTLMLLPDTYNFTASYEGYTNDNGSYSEYDIVNAYKVVIGSGGRSNLNFKGRDIYRVEILTNMDSVEYGKWYINMPNGQLVPYLDNARKNILFLRSGKYSLKSYIYVYTNNSISYNMEYPATAEFTITNKNLVTYAVVNIP
jgi:uncharacterized protein YjdB